MTSINANQGIVYQKCSVAMVTLIVISMVTTNRTVITKRATFSNSDATTGHVFI